MSKTLSIEQRNFIHQDKEIESKLNSKYFIHVRTTFEHQVQNNHFFETKSIWKKLRFISKAAGD